MTKYEAMLSEDRKACSTRMAVMVKNGKTVEEAKTAMNAKAERRFAAISARAKCGITNRPATIGEILAAKVRG